MSNNLLEGELFGYEKGAFPGVKESKKGAIEIAEKGALFLEEVSDMGWDLQAKLLAVLQDGHYSKVGGSEELSARMRVICSTRSDLDAAVACHSFRSDLLSGFSLIRVRLLPLRERREDIPLLCEYLLDKLARIYKKSPPRLSGPALQVLQQWKWPGNMRELENWIARIIIFGTEEVLGLEFSRQLAAMSTVGQRHHRISHLRSGAIKRARRPRGG
jgi:transcriptional regulator with PAS, ATPase and Fis domain